MSLLRILFSLFDIPRDKPALALAQLRIFSRQLPFMYGIIITSMLALSYTHYQLAPRYLTVYIPAVLFIFAIRRVVLHRRFRTETDPERVRALLKSMLMMGALMGSFFSAWSMALYPYGTPLLHGHMIFFMGITSFACLTSLVHFRPGAIALVLSTLVPASIFFISKQEPMFVVIAANMLIVAALAIAVLSGFYQKFVESVDDQQALIAKQIETQKLSDENSHLANLDILTDLPNRRGFFAEFERRLSQNKAEPLSLVVGVLDLDGFKPINDIYGHHTGDKLLIQVAERLREHLPKSVYVARIGGDEFGLIFGPETVSGKLLTEAERICAWLREPFDMGGFVAQMTGSLGLAAYNGGGDTAEALFERADYALYYAKDFKKGGVVLFSDTHAETIRQVNGIEHRLRDADLEAELYLAFQPIMDLQSQRVCGLEVLARWDNPILGAVPPDTFIRAAERAGMINRLTEILFRKALNAAQNFPEDVFLSFNLSPYDIGAPECVLRLISMFEKSGMSAKRLVFEITETAVMQDFNRACETLQCLKNIGARIALDDFGTGYSSLSHVRLLPLDKLKVDRSFVTELVHDATARSVMQAVIDLCRNLDFDCIIEGVETEDQLKILTEMGCRFVQGYLICRPMKEALVADYLAADHVRSAAV